MSEKSTAAQRVSPPRSRWPVRSFSRTSGDTIRPKISSSRSRSARPCAIRLNESLSAPISSSAPAPACASLSSAPGAPSPMVSCAAAKSPRRTAFAASVSRRRGRTMVRARSSARSVTTAPTKSALSTARRVTWAKGSTSLASGS